MSHDNAATFRAAFGLALAAAVSLGMARFSYALLLPPMRADLGWSYLTAGAMNTVNAAGYLVGALLAPRWLVRQDPRRLLLAASTAIAALLAAHGLVTGDAALFALRWLSGIASALMFVSGGLLAARLVAVPAAAGAPITRLTPGLALGIFYGGTGVGIIASAMIVPPLAHRLAAHAWQSAWWALAAAALVATFAMARATRRIVSTRSLRGADVGFAWRRFTFGLAAYFMFGLGYIGYMTFVVTLLREQGHSAALIVAFYSLLGSGVIASSWLWAGLLQRVRDGKALSLLSALLAVATLLPVLSPRPSVVFASGALFGAVFLSLVASTTALVRHNLPPTAWPAGIAGFTIVFAAGQIVGPSAVGWVADGAGGLARGFLWSAAALALASLLAWRQRALPVAA